MRAFLSISLVAAALLAAGAAQAEPKAPPRGVQLVAFSATEHGVQAAHTGAQLEVGYSTSTRRIADCLASYPGYNPKTDMIWARSGPKQRCRL